ncbi:MAG: hypothetical protein Q4C22_02855, partial [Bacillota bacterium]|nr:hypothetical protein [Bacillota bacterium]
FWQYLHEPFNDGLHPQAALLPSADTEEERARLTEEAFAAAPVLSLSIPRFDLDGKYLLRHWQKDDTARSRQEGGFPFYDKLSNVETLTFYVGGTASAPWITHITTRPSPVRDGVSWTVSVGVEDEEKDPLSLLTEVYKDKRLLHSHRKTGLVPGAGGAYPDVLVEGLPAAAPGVYEIVCTVRDETGAGVDSLKFTVVSEGRIAGAVSHTEAWDQNRKKYNLARFSKEYNEAVSFDTYTALSKPRPRYGNVFWSGEEFLLEAAVAGSPFSVSAQIAGTAYSTPLANTGRRNDAGEALYSGSLWDEAMVNQWGRQSPESLSFVFTARYPEDVVKTHTVSVILDTDTDYWQLHRLW